MKIISGSIDISDWDIDLSEEALSIENSIKALAGSILSEVFNPEGSSYMTFPVIWDMGADDQDSSDGMGGIAVKDPLYDDFVAADISSSNKDDLVVRESLRDILSHPISDCSGDGSFSFGLARLSVSFREIADQIDEAIRKGNKH